MAHEVGRIAADLGEVARTAQAELVAIRHATEAYAAQMRSAAEADASRLRGEAAAMHAEAERLLVARNVLKPGDTYAITCGEPMGYPGGTNMLKVCRVG